MATKIRGPTDAQSQMILGQVRKVFDPNWIQALKSGRITIQFQQIPGAKEELIRFMDMHGYELWAEDESARWPEYTFEKDD